MDMRPGVMILAWSQLKEVQHDATPHDLLNQVFYVGQRYGLTPYETLRLHEALQVKDRVPFENTLRRAVNRGTPMRVPSLPHVGSLWVRKSDGVKGRVDEILEGVILLLIPNQGVVRESPFTFRQRYRKAFRSEGAAGAPILASHREKAQEYATTPLGIETVAQALANLEQRVNRTAEARDCP